MGLEKEEKNLADTGEARACFKNPVVIIVDYLII